MKYSFGEMRKTITAAIFLAGAIAAVFLSDYDHNFTRDFAALAGALFAAIGVFMAKNHTEDDLSKAVVQLQGAALTVVGYFVTVQPGTIEKITILTGALVSVAAVYLVRNDNPSYAPAPAARGETGVPEAARG